MLNPGTLQNFVSSSSLEETEKERKREREREREILQQRGHKNHNNLFIFPALLYSPEIKLVIVNLHIISGKEPKTKTEYDRNILHETKLK